MHEFHGVFERDDVNRFGQVDFVQDCGQRGGFAGAGGAGDDHQTGLFLWNVLEDLRHLQFFQRRDGGGQLAADRGIIAALRKDIDAKARFFRQRVGRVARAVLQEVLQQQQIVADEIERNRFRLERGQVFNRRFNSHRLEFAEGFHLKRAVHGEKQIGHFRLRGQHRGHDSVHFRASHKSGVVVLRRMG